MDEVVGHDGKALVWPESKPQRTSNSQPQSHPPRLGTRPVILLPDPARSFFSIATAIHRCSKDQVAMRFKEISSDHVSVIILHYV